MFRDKMLDQEKLNPKEDSKEKLQGEFTTTTKLSGGREKKLQVRIAL